MIDKHQVDVDKLALQISVYRFDNPSRVCLDVPWKLLPWEVTVPLLEWLAETGVQLPMKPEQNPCNY